MIFLDEILKVYDLSGGMIFDKVCGMLCNDSCYN